MKLLVIAPRARTDLRRIVRGIAVDNPERAMTFEAELYREISKTAERPFTFPARDDLSPGLRAARYEPYLIFFRVLDETVRIVAITHGRRNLAAVFRH